MEEKKLKIEKFRYKAKTAIEIVWQEILNLVTIEHHYHQPTTTTSLASASATATTNDHNNDINNLNNLNMSILWYSTERLGSSVYQQGPL